MASVPRAPRVPRARGTPSVPRPFIKRAPHPHDYRFPTAEQPRRSTTAGMHLQESDAFLNGEWTDTPASTMVARARFVSNYQPSYEESVALHVPTFEEAVTLPESEIGGVPLAAEITGEETGVLEVVFVKSGVHWGYDCTKREAWEWAVAPSKGGALWDLFIWAGNKGYAL